MPMFQSNRHGFIKIQINKTCRFRSATTDSAMEYENLERKYIEVKTKLKKAVQNNEKYQLQIQKLNKNIKHLENENRQLNNQISVLQSTNESESDLSSAERQNGHESSLATLLQTKNIQITNLLKDFEEIEIENTELKEKLAEIKDELSVATSEITSITEVLKGKESVLCEQYELNKTLTVRIDELQEELQMCKKEKDEAEKSLENFSSQVNKRVDDWKVLLDKKNEEIERLKNAHSREMYRFSPESFDKQDKVGDAYAENLKRALDEAETQVLRLKGELEKSTRDIKDGTDLTNKLSSEKKALEEKIAELTEKEADSKNQLMKAHNRCQNMQNEIEFSNRMVKTLEEELTNIKTALRKRGNVDLVAKLDNSQNLKIRNLFNEKQIEGLIRDINRLQESCNVFEMENDQLRARLGIEADETVPVDPEYVSEVRRQQRTIDKLRSKVRSQSEEKVKLKTEIKDLNAKVRHLTDEIREVKRVPVEEPEKISPDNRGDSTKEEIRVLSEENEALRKGLHEILKNVREKSDTSPREIKSEILEKLLKALDVKHISGWYHPAMRLQAELHTLEGVNGELREQLRLARLEIDDLKFNQKEKTDKNSMERVGNIQNKTEEISDKSPFDPLFRIDANNLNELKVTILNIVISLIEMDANVKDDLNDQFDLVQQKLVHLHDACRSEKTELLERLESLEQSLLNVDGAEETKNEESKVQFVLKEWHDARNEILKLKRNVDSTEKRYLAKQESLLEKVLNLRLKLRITEKSAAHSIGRDQFRNVENSLNDLVVKQRKLLMSFEEQKEMFSSEIELLKRSYEDAVGENKELKGRLNEALCDSYRKRAAATEEDASSLSAKLAETEVRALSEQQRADHTNNLFNLVKEQLRKSEEKLAEFSKYGESLLQNNLSLQERVVELEGKISTSVDPEMYEELERNLNWLMKEKEELVSKNCALMEECRKLTNERDEQLHGHAQNEQELLDLRHKIVDLTVTSDKTFLISQLHSDLAKCRSEVKSRETEISRLKDELDVWENKYDELSIKIDEGGRHFELFSNSTLKKITKLQDIILKQRTQYHGYVPLVAHEMFAEKLRQLNVDRHEEYVNLLRRKGLDRPENETSQFFIRKIDSQARTIEKLEKELLSVYRHVGSNDDTKTSKSSPNLSRRIVSQESIEPKTVQTGKKVMRNVESQTDSAVEPSKSRDELAALKAQISSYERQISETRHQLYSANNLLSQKSAESVKLTEQIDENNAKITALEERLVKLTVENEPKRTDRDSGGAGDGIDRPTDYFDQQILALKINLKSSQDKLNAKDIEIMKYQNLLKEDRDKHSLAAAHLQKELALLQRALESEQSRNKTLEEAVSLSHQKTTIVEKYVSQVRALEKHLADLHTQQAKLESQLSAAQQETIRWRQLAQERLGAMQDLARSLNEQHIKELTSYKTDYEKLRELSADESHHFGNERFKLKSGDNIDADVLKLFREKDEKIRNLTAKLNEVRNRDKLEIEGSATDHEKVALTEEIEIIRKRYDILVVKEKNAREEIRVLKDKLSKRSITSARNAQSEKSIREQLQRKVNHLEKEIDDLNNKLAQQTLVNEKHKLNASVDFEKWKKQKFWQENCEKLKTKLQEREEQLEKLQQTCTSYRLLIERLEREKVNLENRVKSLKTNGQMSVVNQEVEHLKSENARLYSELETMQTKMEIRQQSAGALGAALMQEKLEAQERKIAILELSAKGSVELRNELERTQTSLSNLQKKNLCLEAENLELKMDVEKYMKETPHLQEQLHHLENYIELLKNENRNCEKTAEHMDDKKVTDLERTVYVLKRVVEKLQVENKRLHGVRRMPTERSSSADKLRREIIRLKDQLNENVEKLKDVEANLNAANKKIKFLENGGNDNLTHLKLELDQVKDQLVHKTTLLDKVKEMLHAAASREKDLLRQINELRHSHKAERDADKGNTIELPSPIEEISEDISEEEP